MSFWSIIERWYEKYWGKGISHIVMDRPPSTNEECRCPTKVFFTGDCSPAREIPSSHLKQHFITEPPQTRRFDPKWWVPPKFSIFGFSIRNHPLKYPPWKPPFSLPSSCWGTPPFQAPLRQRLWTKHGWSRQAPAGSGPEEVTHVWDVRWGSRRGILSYRCVWMLMDVGRCW